MVNTSGELKASQDDATPKTNNNGNTVTAKTSSSSSLSTRINTVLSAAILIGFGAIVGYMVFYSIYNHRCSDMLDDAERRFNQTREDLNHKLLEAIHQPNNDDDDAGNTIYNNEGGSESELLELRGRLEEQAIHWMDKHQTLLDKHQSTVEQLNQIQVKQLQTSQLEKNYQMSLKQVSALERKLNVASVQKEASGKRLKQANEKVERLQQEAKTGEASSSNDCEAIQQQSMSHIQKLHSAICKEKCVLRYCY
jgi:DNA repair ATPase RecN